MSNETKHQLIPNTYCICESKKQCKELFEWAKDNEIDVYDNCQSNDIILYVDVDMEIGSCCEEHEVKGYTLITLPEFLLRLQGNWQPNEVSVTAEPNTWDIDEHPFIPPNPVNTYKLSCCKPERMVDLLNKEAKLDYLQDNQTHYQSLYEELLVKHEKITQGVKDAKNEMEKKRKHFGEHIYSRIAYRKALEILTEKTGI
jgi:hypothetical protein